ncbi:MAG: hypothetical protein ACJAUV_000572 [Flavobacteriales bacterium]|jgi:hypothetical protein
MKLVLFFVGLLICSIVVGQSNKPELFPDLIRYHNTGWVIEPGATYQLNQLDESFSFQKNDTAYQIDASAQAKFGGVFNFGLHHWFPRGIIINDIDYGLGVKYFAGAEDQTIIRTIGASEPKTLEQQPGWKELQATFTVNFNRIIQLAYYNFLKIGIGADVNYRVLDQREDDLLAAAFQSTDNNPWIMQSHVSIGYGFSIGDRWYLTPKVEMPLFDLSDFSINSSARKHYLVGQRPIMFTLQFKNRWMRRQDKCGPGEKPVDLNAGKRKRKKKKGIKNGQLR